MSNLNLSKSKIVNIGDYVDVKIVSEEDEFVETLHIVSDYQKSDNEIYNLTIDSPLGEAIYKQKVGDVVTYSVGKNKFTATILSISAEPQNEAQEPEM